MAFNESGLTDSFENRVEEGMLETGDSKLSRSISSTLAPAKLVMDGIWMVVAGLYLVSASLLIHGARKVGTGNRNVKSLRLHFTHHNCLFVLNVTHSRRGLVLSPSGWCSQTSPSYLTW